MRPDGSASSRWAGPSRPTALRARSPTSGADQGRARSAGRRRDRNIYADEAPGTRGSIHRPAGELGAADVASLRDGIRKALRLDPPSGGHAPRLPASTGSAEACRTSSVSTAVPGSRASGHADREDPGRGPRHLVLPGLPAGSLTPGSGARAASSPRGPARPSALSSVNPDWPAVEQDLRNRPTPEVASSNVRRKAGSSSRLISSKGRSRSRRSCRARSQYPHHVVVYIWILPIIRKTLGACSIPAGATRVARMSSRTLSTEAVVLRSIRFSEADCVLHLYTLAKGRVGAIAKGVRKTRSRFGARLSRSRTSSSCSTRAAVTSHTVRGAELVRSHDCPDRPVPARRRPHRPGGGAQTLRRGGGPAARVPRAHPVPRPVGRRRGGAARAACARAARPLVPAEAPVAFGYLPHLASCAACGEPKPSSPSRPAREEPCVANASRGAPRLGSRVPRDPALLEQLLSGARGLALGDDAIRQCLRVIEASYEEHGGFRLRTLSA